MRQEGPQEALHKDTQVRYLRPGNGQGLKRGDKHLEARTGPSGANVLVGGRCLRISRLQPGECQFEVDEPVGELDEEPVGCVGGISLGAPSAFNWSAVRSVP